MNFALRITFVMMLSAGIWAQTRPLAFEDMFEMGRVSGPVVSPAGDWIAYTVTRYSVAKNKGNTQIYLVSPDGKQHKQLTRGEASSHSPQWSPDGRKLAFISAREGGSQVYLLDMAGGEATRKTDIATGVNGFEWSPDGQNLAIITDLYPEADSPEASEAMGEKKAGNGSSGRVIDGLMFRHWNAWREGKFSKVLVVPVAGGSPVLLNQGAMDCPPVSLGSSHDVAWSPDGKELCLVMNPDKMVAASTNNDLFVVPAGGGNPQAITSNKGNDNGPRYSPDGRYIAYMSMARAGFEADQQDLILYDRRTRQTVNLTASLDRNVEEMVWSPKSDKLYFTVPNHGRHRLYEVGIKGGKPRLLLDKTYLGGIAVMPDGRSLVVRHQTSAMPYELSLFNTGNRRLTRLTHVNDAALAGLEMNDIEDHYFIGAKGDSIHLMVVKPPQFDAAQKYPMVNMIHGGPQGAWGDDFHFRWNSQLFAAPGYVVIMINFHGSRGYGQAFCDAVSKDWGGAPYQDIMTGTQWAVENLDFVDGERIGAAGASYGGFMINWIAGHDPENLFKALISHCGVYEQHSMFGATEELWFPMWEFGGKPWEEGSLYDKWNPMDYAANFKTPTLVITGEHDYRVPYTQSLQMFTALQTMNVPSRLLFFPDEDHFVRKPKNARLWWGTMHEWLGRYLKTENKEARAKKAM
ncbi:MAG TPA: S9 family peptidase [Calditrichia bacterium]|nr:S9 family peptidase [Calditrichota bacterium]HQV30515.1 S9 family peptidase [Calditrichia bacterium]